MQMCFRNPQKQPLSSTKLEKVIEKASGQYELNNPRSATNPSSTCGNSFFLSKVM